MIDDLVEIRLKQIVKRSLIKEGQDLADGSPDIIGVDVQRVLDAPASSAKSSAEAQQRDDTENKAQYDRTRHDTDDQHREIVGRQYEQYYAYGSKKCNQENYGFSHFSS